MTYKIFQTDDETFLFRDNQGIETSYPVNEWLAVRYVQSTQGQIIDYKIAIEHKTRKFASGIPEFLVYRANVSEWDMCYEFDQQYPLMDRANDVASDDLLKRINANMSNGDELVIPLMNYNVTEDVITTDTPLATRRIDLEGHRLMSMGENIAFENRHTGIIWSPTWTGMMPYRGAGDEGFSIRPSGRVYSKEVYHSVDYPSDITQVPATAILAVVESASYQSFKFSTNQNLTLNNNFRFDLKVRYDDVNGSDIYERRWSLDNPDDHVEVNGRDVEIFFDLPLEVHKGQNIYVELGYLTYRASISRILLIDSVFGTTQPAFVASFRKFFDADLVPTPHLETSDFICDHADIHYIDTTNNIVNISVEERFGIEQCTFVYADGSNNIIVSVNGATITVDVVTARIQIFRDDGSGVWYAHVEGIVGLFELTAGATLKVSDYWTTTGVAGFDTILTSQDGDVLVGITGNILTSGD